MTEEGLGKNGGSKCGGNKPKEVIKNLITEFDKSHVYAAPLKGPKHEIMALFNTPGEALASRHIEACLDIAQNALFYHLKGLLALGLIRKIPKVYPNLYELTDAGTSYFQRFIRKFDNSLRGPIKFDNLPTTDGDKSGPKKLRVRGHNIKLKAEVVKYPDKLLFQDPKFSEVGTVELKNWEKVKARFNGDYFFLTRNCVVFQPQPVHGDPLPVLLSVFQASQTLFKTLEEANPGLKISEEYTFLLSQEFSLEKDAFARACYVLNQTIANSRFKVDFSKGYELEFIHKELAASDAAKYECLIHDVIDSKIDPKKLDVKRFQAYEFLLYTLVERGRETEAFAVQTRDLLLGELEKLVEELLMIRVSQRSPRSRDQEKELERGVSS